MDQIVNEVMEKADHLAEEGIAVVDPVQRAGVRGFVPFRFKDTRKIGEILTVRFDGGDEVIPAVPVFVRAFPLPFLRNGGVQREDLTAVGAGKDGCAGGVILRPVPCGVSGGNGNVLPGGVFRERGQHRRRGAEQKKQTYNNTAAIRRGVEAWFLSKYDLIACSTISSTVHSVSAALSSSASDSHAGISISIASPVAP